MPERSTRVSFRHSGNHSSLSVSLFCLIPPNLLSLLYFITTSEEGQNGSYAFGLTYPCAYLSCSHPSSLPPSICLPERSGIPFLSHQPSSHLSFLPLANSLLICNLNSLTGCATENGDRLSSKEEYGPD